MKRKASNKSVHWVSASGTGLEKNSPLEKYLKQRAVKIRSGKRGGEGAACVNRKQ